MVEVVVAEPNPLLRIGIRAVLGRHPDIVVAGEAVDGRQLLAAMAAARPGVLFVGLGLLREVGVAPFRALRETTPACGILVHSYEWDAGFADEAARYGATGYVSHECSAPDLYAAVLDVAAGRPFVTRDLGDVIATAACFRAEALQHAPLSARERRLSMMMALGVSQSGIAAQLDIHEQDVAQTTRRIMAKAAPPGAGVLVRHAIAQACRPAF